MPSNQRGHRKNLAQGRLALLRGGTSPAGSPRNREMRVSVALHDRTAAPGPAGTQANPKWNPGFQRSCGDACHAAGTLRPPPPPPPPGRRRHRRADVACTLPAVPADAERELQHKSAKKSPNLGLHEALQRPLGGSPGAPQKARVLAAPPPGIRAYGARHARWVFPLKSRCWRTSASRALRG